MELNENSISTTHRLPDTKKNKNRIIVKFVHRDTRKSLQKEGKSHEEVNERSSIWHQENWKINSKGKLNLHQ